MIANACARCGAKLADGDVDPDQVARHAFWERYCGSSCKELEDRGVPHGSEPRPGSDATGARDLLDGGTVRLRDKAWDVVGKSSQPKDTP